MRANSGKLDWKGISFQALGKISLSLRHKTRNPYRVNVFGYERGVYTLRKDSYKDEDGCKYRMVINLLLMSDG